MQKNLLLFLLLAMGMLAQAQAVDPSLYSMLRWRMIGPHRGGRTVGAVGVPQQPNVFYIGVNNGGVWKTTDYGRTWQPIFDDQPTGSIGDVAVSPADPNVIYVGSGEGLQRPDLSVGDGIYRSGDGGKTWSNMGLRDAQQIGGLAVDPTNANRLFVAALGHPYGPNEERGVFRTLDGGKTWKKVLYKDENTGAIQVAIDPQNPNIIYADLWASRQGPWENGAWQGPASGLFKSNDGGDTWQQLTDGLPTTAQGLGRIGFSVAPSDPRRIYAAVDAGASSGIYRSDDAGAHWSKIQTDGRLFGRGSDFAEIKVDPKNADIVYTANVVTWRSADGGHSWSAFRGAPGGDDYHRIWINPNNPDIILIASDQGAIITVNGGETFSSWYNQPTAQFYHVSTDNSFPYRVYGGQQESGSVGIASRGNDGQITFREWHPVGAEEYGYVAADPLDPDIVYGGKLSKFNWRTGQTQDVAPQESRKGQDRFLRTAPVIFSPADPKTLFYAGNVLFKTRDGGNSWQVISPDLTRAQWEVPKSVGVYADPSLRSMPRRGVIYTIAPSYKDVNTIWCGTDDGLIQLTKDGGKTWKDVTPPAIGSWNKISIMDAGHFDTHTAYAAVNCIRVDDMRPHIYRTHDDGKTWTEIVTGLPNDPINVVREDPVRKGLLFAGSERAVYVSFDDGAHWQSLRNNMPAASIRDLVIKDADLVIGTHGRSFWIMDGITALRQMKTTSSATLYAPAPAFRVRWNMNTDTPLPQEEPGGQNPPDGAPIDYYLPQDASSVTLEISDAQGRIIRRYSNNDTLYAVPPVNIPLYWIRPQEWLSAAKGAHRIVWDLHEQPLNVPPSYPIAAVYMNTAPRPTGPFVMPGNYQLKLLVNGQAYAQTLMVKMDPRVKTAMKDLQLQRDLSLQCYQLRKQALDAINELEAARSFLKNMIARSREQAPALHALDDEADHLLHGIPNGDAGLYDLQNGYAWLISQLQDSDMPPTMQMRSGVSNTVKRQQPLMAQWNVLKKKIEGLK